MPDQQRKEARIYESTDDERSAVLGVLHRTIDLDLAQVASRSRLAPSRALAALITLYQSGQVRTVLLPDATEFRWKLPSPPAGGESDTCAHCNRTFPMHSWPNKDHDFQVRTPPAGGES